jgi:hypothetical protein
MNQNPAPLRHGPEVWAAVRADYLAGISAPVVAERYGVSERSVRRRAAAEGWRREDLETVALDSPPPWSFRPHEKAEVLDQNPELQEVTAARESEQFFLLFNPEPGNLRQFAFRRAAEAAATDAPQQAVVWMRLAQLVDRCGDRIAREARHFSDLDMLRAAYLRRLDEDVAREGAEGGPEVMV